MPRIDSDNGSQMRADGSAAPSVGQCHGVEQLYDYQKSFLENRDAGPQVDLHPASDAVLEVTTDRHLLGFPVGYPIGVPASPLTASAVWIRLLSQQGFNVLTYKTSRSVAHDSQPPPNWLFLEDLTEPLSLETDLENVNAVSSAATQPHDLRAFSMANSFGIPSLSADAWKTDVANSIETLRPGQILIVSVVGNYEDLDGQELVDDFVSAACSAKEALSAHPNAPCGRAIELNLSCPNTISRAAQTVATPICETPESVHRIVKAVRTAIGNETRLVIKLGYLDRDRLADVVAGVADEVDAVAGINTLQVKVVDPNGDPAFRGTVDDPDSDRDKAGLSGIAIRNFALDFVQSLALLRRTNDWHFDIIAMGGVMEPHDVRMLLASGADAVQTATAAANHPRFPSTLLADGPPELSDESKLAQLLAGALDDSRWDFRTSEGIAAQLHLAPEDVAVLLRRHPEIARRSVMNSADGRELYTRRDRPLTVRERLEQARSLLAHNQ